MRRIDPNMPWGSWLRIEKVGSGWRHVDDDTGETWHSVREAFWNGRMGMPLPNDRPPPDLLEIVHAVLAMAARRSVDERELVADLHQRSELFARHYRLWLAGAGLVALDETGNAIVGLTDEGRAVLLMLIATRPHDVRQSPPTSATIAALAELGMGPEGREERLSRLEAEAASWDAAFLRRNEGGRPAVILSKRGNGPMRSLQTVWSLSFRSEEDRDRFHEWLCRRLDRWPDWAGLASEFGSHKLTHRLLAIMVAGLDGAETAPPAPRLAGLIGR